MIPADLRIFSFIYEYRGFLLIPLLLFWSGMALRYLFQWKKKAFFLWLLVLPLVIQPLNIAVTYCGWHYRMELRDRFAKAEQGWTDPHSAHSVNIDLMPPEIRAEYGKHNYHPRFRDLKAMIIGTVLLTPLLYILGGLMIGTVFWCRKILGKVS